MKFFFAATKASEGWTPFLHKKLQNREENFLEAISDTGQSGSSASVAF